LGRKLVFGQIAFNAKTLLAILVEDQNRRRPQNVETVEGCGIPFDMDGGGNETFFNELYQLGVSVRFGFQPSASASGGCCAEVEQDGLMLRLCVAECAVYILDPVDCHECLLALT